jgi:hypothetical protein
MTVLSESPYAVPTEKLNTLKVKDLYLGGELYRPQCGTAFFAVLRGMFAKGKI